MSVPSIVSPTFEVLVLTGVVIAISKVVPAGSRTVRVAAAGTAGEDVEVDFVLPPFGLLEAAAAGFGDSTGRVVAASGSVVSWTVAGFSAGSAVDTSVSLFFEQAEKLAATSRAAIGSTSVRRFFIIPPLARCH